MNALHYANLSSSSYQNYDATPTNAFGRFMSIEWMDEVDWYRPEDHTRGWIPILDPTDTPDSLPAKWARMTKTVLDFVQDDEGYFSLMEGMKVELLADCQKFRNLVEHVAEHPSYDAGIHSPPLFDVDRIDLQYITEKDIHRMVADARRSVLANWGQLSWWTASIRNWYQGLDRNICEEIHELGLTKMNKQGFLISLHQDWRELNFPLLIDNHVPLFYIHGVLDGRDKHFIRLDPTVMTRYLSELERREVTELWADDLPLLAEDLKEAERYNSFL
ncbi:hypothetical protein B0H13DRAFT_2344765 [Mycena leptocephala]|nr:hypothetical protein B0H13DRAFT_2344765 [Mycena leptocephala]